MKNLSEVLRDRIRAAKAAGSAAQEAKRAHLAQEIACRRDNELRAELRTLMRDARIDEKYVVVDGITWRVDSEGSAYEISAVDLTPDYSKPEDVQVP